jgi:FAD/FMN-containing dehydrogenase
LANGEVISSMNHLIKNNTGYDLKQLFIGSEGTLGVITRLVLRLREDAVSRQMALVAVEDFASVPRLLKHMDSRLGGALSAFEVMWSDFYRLVTSPPAKGRPPLSQDYPYYVLMEAQGASEDGSRFQAALEQAFEHGWIADAALSQSESDCEAFWALRDDVEQTFHLGIPVVFDVSLPIAHMADYTASVRASIQAEIQDAIVWIFGHLGDGNLHIIVQSPGIDVQGQRPFIEGCVYEPLQSIGGSVSAEHGIGLEKKPWLRISRSENEIALMRRIKEALDPDGILNPGKIFS